MHLGGVGEGGRLSFMEFIGSFGEVLCHLFKFFFLFFFFLLTVACISPCK